MNRIFEGIPLFPRIGLVLLPWVSQVFNGFKRRLNLCHNEDRPICFQLPIKNEAILKSKELVESFYLLPKQNSTEGLKRPAESISQKIIDSGKK